VISNLIGQSESEISILANQNPEFLFWPIRIQDFDFGQSESGISILANQSLRISIFNRTFFSEIIEQVISNGLVGLFHHDAADLEKKLTNEELEVNAPDSEDQMIDQSQNSTHR